MELAICIQYHDNEDDHEYDDSDGRDENADDDACYCWCLYLNCNLGQVTHHLLSVDFFVSSSSLYSLSEDLILLTWIQESFDLRQQRNKGVKSNVSISQSSGYHT